MYYRYRHGIGQAYIYDTSDIKLLNRCYLQLKVYLCLVEIHSWLSCHTDVLLTDFIFTTRCCQWQPIYPSKCIVHKTYFLRNQVIHSDPTSRNKISNQPTTHILYSSRSSFCGRYRVRLWFASEETATREEMLSTSLQKSLSCWLLEFHFSKSMILICSRCRYHFCGNRIFGLDNMSACPKSM